MITVKLAVVGWRGWRWAMEAQLYLLASRLEISSVELGLTINGRASRRWLPYTASLLQLPGNGGGRDQNMGMAAVLGQRVAPICAMMTGGPTVTSKQEYDHGQG